MQIFPQQNFTVVRQIADHTDLTTYYVQAVVRNAFTDEIIETLNLESKGSQRYKKDWKVPADRSGQGTWISIITSVYEDSGYSTKSSLYGDEEATHVILAREVIGRGSGGGSLSIRDIKDAVREIVLENKPKKTKSINLKDIEFPEQKEYEDQFNQIISTLNEIKEAISAIPTEKVDLTPVLDKLTRSQESIDAIDIPELDLTPVLEALTEDRSEKNEQHDEISKPFKKFVGGFEKAIFDTVTKVIKETNFVMSSLVFVNDEKPTIHSLNIGEKKLKEEEEQITNKFPELLK